VPGGRLGTGLTTATAFSIPEESTSWWLGRLRLLGVNVQPVAQRNGSDVITLRDPDGMVLDLVTTAGDERSGWDGVASIPSDHAVRGLHAVTLTERLLDPTAEMLTSMLGMHLGDVVDPVPASRHPSLVGYYCDGDARPVERGDGIRRPVDELDAVD